MILHVCSQRYHQCTIEGSSETLRAEKREANSLVEEFMLLANVSAAHAVTSAFPEAALRRCHPPPKPLKKLQELEELCHQLVRQI